MKFNNWVNKLSCGAMNNVFYSSVVGLYVLQKVNFSGIKFYVYLLSYCVILRAECIF